MQQLSAEREAKELPANELVHLVDKQAECRQFVEEYHCEHGIVPHPSTLSRIFMPSCTP
jgi:hypothetical protein